MTNSPIWFFKYLINKLCQPFTKKSKKEIYFTSIEKYSKDLKALKEQQKEFQA